MRISILIGSLAIAEAINPSWITNDPFKFALGVLIFLFLLMDAADFAKNHKKK